ncbi:DUF6676 family protein [Nocardia wallacei]|uniref:Uncharacterized protein n=1 Tax=Nocardia wallacei TaxID=480035 RepID=A0A7G1KPN7_9NOCA|nr:DUF6676 family protein [Nocardia wallacei]BCK55809.1 hypothetical protein NWFMUON74_35810 [Nocardia wallacei]
MTVFDTSVLTPKTAELPHDTDLNAVLADLADNHVATPKGQKQGELAAIVQDARDNGIPLSIVVVEGNPAPDSSLRDLATKVGKTEHGTVVVLSDDWAGTYSESISRYRLERAEDVAKNRHGGHSAEAAQAFVGSLEAPETVSSTVAASIFIAAIAVVVVVLYRVKLRRSANTTPGPESAAGSAAAGKGAE